MICTNLHAVIGFECHPLDADGQLAQITTPFTFADGERLPIYVQTFENNVHRFFDDGQTILHFLGRGMKLKNGNQLRFLASLAEKNGASLNKNGVLEVLSTSGKPELAFSKLVSCLVDVTNWEKEHEGLNSDAAAFAAEVAHALLERTPSGHFEKSPAYLGSSGKRYELDFKFNGVGYVAIRPNQQSAAPALFKLVDIINRSTNDDQEFCVVIDDRDDQVAAKSTSQVFRSTATVVNFSRIAAAHSTPTQ